MTNDWTTYTIPSTPDPALSPNSRKHWHAKHRASKQARELARITVFSQNIHYDLTENSRILIRWEVHWSGRRKRMDDDNLIASLKPFRDGISDAIGGNDAQWITTEVTQTTGNTTGTTVVHLQRGD
jgi:hypothetical protein